jgi:hypothetical protein
MTRAWPIVMIVGLAVFAVFLGAFGIIFVRGKQSLDAGPPDGLVGQVPVAELARLIAAAETRPGPDAAQADSGLANFPPFVIVVSPLRMPREPARVKCTWSKGRPLGADASRAAAPGKGVGRLQDYEIVAQNDESRKVGTWMQNGKELARQDVKSGTDYFVDFDLHPDGDNIEQVVRIDAQLVPHPAAKSAIAEFGRYRTYHLSFLCEDGDEAAFLVETWSEAGHGLLCVIRFDGGLWRAFACEETWVA